MGDRSILRAAVEIVFAVPFALGGILYLGQAVDWWSIMRPATHGDMATLFLVIVVVMARLAYLESRAT